MTVREVVPVNVKPGSEEDFEATIREHLLDRKSDKGCLDIRVSRAVDRVNTFLMLFQWESRDYHVDIFFQIWRRR